MTVPKPQYFGGYKISSDDFSFNIYNLNTTNARSFGVYPNNGFSWNNTEYNYQKVCDDTEISFSRATSPGGIMYISRPPQGKGGTDVVSIKRVRIYHNTTLVYECSGMYESSKTSTIAGTPSLNNFIDSDPYPVAIGDIIRVCLYTS